MKTNRREFISAVVQGTGFAACSAAGLAALVKDSSASGWAPRPPGANAKFVNLCLKCGLCVRACPYDSLKLARLGDRAPLGTPYFEPRVKPCYMCPDIPCAKVCPSGALDRNIKAIEDARMGVAAIDPASCLSYQGLRCEACYRDCPLKDSALKLVPHPRGSSFHAVFVPTVDPNKCTGCGVCEQSCITDLPAIRIVEREKFLGRIGDHYRLGWRGNDQPHNPEKRNPKALIDDEKAGGVDYLNNWEDPAK